MKILEGGNSDLELQVLLIRFRSFFPNTSRKELTAEFTKLVQSSHYDNTKSKRTPLTLSEFKISLSKSKTDFNGIYLYDNSCFDRFCYISVMIILLTTESEKMHIMLKCIS